MWLTMGDEFKVVQFKLVLLCKCQQIFVFALYAHIILNQGKLAALKSFIPHVDTTPEGDFLWNITWHGVFMRRLGRSRFEF